MLADRIGEVRVGQTIEVLADDPAAKTDLPAWCALKSQEFVRATALPSRLVVPGPPQLLTAESAAATEPASLGSSTARNRSANLRSVSHHGRCVTGARLLGRALRALLRRWQHRPWPPGVASAGDGRSLLGVQLGVDHLRVRFVLADHLDQLSRQERQAHDVAEDPQHAAAEYLRRRQVGPPRAGERVVVRARPAGCCRR